MEMPRTGLRDGRAGVAEGIRTPTDTLQREGGGAVSGITRKINLHTAVGYDDTGDVRHGGGDTVGRPGQDEIVDAESSP